MNIGTKIKKLREKRNMSQKDLAFELDISQGALCKIESGIVDKIDFTMINKICDLFEIDFQYFLEDSVTQINQDNKNTAISIFGNPTIYNQIDENFAKLIIDNQIQISQLLENQNKLIEKLLNA